MFEQFFKSQVAAVSDPYQCNRITDALAAAGIKFYCKTKDVNRRNTFDQARIGSLGIKPKYVTEIFVDKENADMALHIVHMFFILTCVFFLLLPQQALMLPQYLVLMNIGWLDSLKGLLIMTAFQPWMILLFWFAAKRIDSSLFDAAICDGANNWVLFRKIYVPIIRPYVAVAAFLSIAESWNLLEQPMTFLQSKEKYPLSMILMQLSTDNAELKNALCLLFVIPLMILFGTMVKKIIDT